MNHMNYFDKFRADAEYERELAAQQLLIQAGDQLNEILNLRGMKRQDLAEKLGVTPGRVSQALRGDENLTLRSLAKLAHALGAEISLRVYPQEWDFEPSLPLESARASWVFLQAVESVVSDSGTDSTQFAPRTSTGDEAVQGLSDEEPLDLSRIAA